MRFSTAIEWSTLIQRTVIQRTLIQRTVHPRIMASRRVTSQCFITAKHFMTACTALIPFLLASCSPSFEDRFDCGDIEHGEIDDVTIRYTHPKIETIYVANGELKIEDNNQALLWFNLYNCDETSHRLQVRASFYDKDHKIIDSSGWTEIYIGVKQVRSGELTSGIQDKNVEIEGTLLELKPLR